MVPFHAEKGQNSSTKNDIISEKFQNSLTKMIPFLKRVKIPKHKYYHFRKWSKFLNKNGTISGRKRSKFLNKNGAISEKGQNSSTKIVPFQKSVKMHQQR